MEKKEFNLKNYKDNILNHCEGVIVGSSTGFPISENMTFEIERVNFHDRIRYPFQLDGTVDIAHEDPNDFTSEILVAHIVNSVGENNFPKLYNLQFNEIHDDQTLFVVLNSDGRVDIYNLFLGWDSYFVPVRFFYL
jgi:hypothetical protein